MTSRDRQREPRRRRPREPTRRTRQSRRKSLSLVLRSYQSTSSSDDGDGQPGRDDDSASNQVRERHVGSAGSTAVAQRVQVHTHFRRRGRMEGHQQNAGAWCTALPLHPPVPPTPRNISFGTLPLPLPLTT